ncbi:TRAP transporter substrate-binding protein [Pollutimonas sp. M17]|uniref:TRAP transporter substrate-binding protein n=1 Tax=Pollutimonas sp. M17 TaxID=2962065 RepID=UPI0021F41CC9|nr:TRAP transporter substrate-binding protein [Pollutimonas sp. M17]UYO93799.1 TRAP transporter substrate-binding protein [Pollutimonas sp. M17]HWK71935.1 TRAP transporter substrate-binding protein [Burkholderiaceae bacterium]
MRRTGFFKCLLAATVAGVFAAAPAMAETTLKMAYALSTNSHYGAGADAFAKAIEGGSKGQLKIQQFPNSALGGEREVIEGLQLGTIDVAIVSTGATLNFVPKTGVFDIPFLFRDLAHARKVLDGEIGQQMLAEFPKRGLIALAWGEQGFRQLTNNVRPVAKPEDAKGLKIRTTENPIHIAAFRELGVLATPMAWPEVATALQQGTIDGQENPLSVIVSAKLPQLQKYLSLTAHVYGPALVLMSPSAYDGLSDADKAMFKAAGHDAAVAMRNYVDAVEKSGIEEVKKQGMQVNTVDHAAFVKAVQPVYPQYYKQFGKELVESIQNTK